MNPRRLLAALALAAVVSSCDKEEPPPATLQASPTHRFSEAFKAGDLEAAEALLPEIASLPDGIVDGYRVQLGLRYLHPGSFDIPPPAWRAVAIAHSEATAGLEGCGSTLTHEAVHARDPAKALALLRAGGDLARAAEAAYHAGDLEAFDTLLASQRKKGEAVAPESPLRRIHLLLGAGKSDEALEAARTLGADGAVKPVVACRAGVIAGRLLEAAKRYRDAVEIYRAAAERAPRSEACVSVNLARAEALAAATDGEPLPTGAVRGRVVTPEGASVTLALQPQSGPFHSLIALSPDEAGRYLALTTSPKDGRFSFDAVPAGDWALVVMAEGAARYGVSKDSCWKTAEVTAGGTVDLGRVTLTSR